MQFRNPKPISEIREEEKIGEKARIEQLEAQLAVEKADKLTTMEAVAELYEMIVTMQGGTS